MVQLQIRFSLKVLYLLATQCIYQEHNQPWVSQILSQSPILVLGNLTNPVFLVFIEYSDSPSKSYTLLINKQNIEKNQLNKSQILLKVLYSLSKTHPQVTKTTQYWVQILPQSPILLWTLANIDLDNNTK
jgi:hypothetical protein